MITPTHAEIAGPLFYVQEAGDQCSKCGCHLVELPNGDPGKTYYPLEMCPIGKWSQEKTN
jgi:hypothetical protein